MPEPFERMLRALPGVAVQDFFGDGEVGWRRIGMHGGDGLLAGGEVSVFAEGVGVEERDEVAETSGGNGREEGEGGRSLTVDEVVESEGGLKVGGVAGGEFLPETFGEEVVGFAGAAHLEEDEGAVVAADPLFGVAGAGGKEGEGFVAVAHPCEKAGFAVEAHGGVVAEEDGVVGGKSFGETSKVAEGFGFAAPGVDGVVTEDDVFVAGESLGEALEFAQDFGGAVAGGAVVIAAGGFDIAGEGFREAVQFAEGGGAAIESDKVITLREDGVITGEGFGVPVEGAEHVGPSAARETIPVEVVFELFIDAEGGVVLASGLEGVAKLAVAEGIVGVGAEGEFGEGVLQAVPSGGFAAPGEVAKGHGGKAGMAFIQLHFFEEQSSLAGAFRMGGGEFHDGVFPAFDLLLPGMQCLRLHVLLLFLPVEGLGPEVEPVEDSGDGADGRVSGFPAKKGAGRVSGGAVGGEAEEGSGVSEAAAGGIHIMPLSAVSVKRVNTIS